MRIYGFHDSSGCGEYRIKLPLRELAKHGHDITLEMGGTGTGASSYQIVIAQRTDKYDALPVWRRLRAQSRLVYEIDDDVFSVEPVNWMAYRAYAKPVPQDAVAHAAEVADLVTVTTEPLAEVMRRFNRNVAVIPNHVPTEILDVQRPRRDHLVVGWAGGASHAADVSMIAAQVRRFFDRTPGTELHLIGTNYAETFRRPARFTRWNPDLMSYYRNVDFDIGLAPLTGTVFDRAKSHIKALEYGALGIPVIASDVEPYRDFVIDGVTGFLVKREHEWFSRLRDLANDAELRESMGRKAKEQASAWTIEKGWKLWEACYQSLL
jgi:glycosyltransferase involved in cell wall biosynthesis